MSEETTEPLQTNITFADVFVPVEVRGKLALRIIRVNDGDVLEAQNFVSGFDGRLRAFFRRDVVAGTI